MDKLWRILGKGHHYWVVGDYTYSLCPLFLYSFSAKWVFVKLYRGNEMNTILFKTPIDCG